MNQSHIDPSRFQRYRESIFPNVDFLDSLVAGREDAFDRDAAAQGKTGAEIATGIRLLQARHERWTQAEATHAWKNAQHFRETIDLLIPLLEPNRTARRTAGRKSDPESDIICAITRWLFECRGNRAEIAKGKAARLLGVSANTIDKASKRAWVHLIRQQHMLSQLFPTHDFNEWAVSMFFGMATEFKPKANEIAKSVREVQRLQFARQRAARFVTPISAKLEEQ